jgi:hypothetical protein
MMRRGRADRDQSTGPGFLEAGEMVSTLYCWAKPRFFSTGEIRTFLPFTAYSGVLYHMSRISLREEEPW